MSTIEAWIVERYGKITFAELGMEPLVVYSAAVAVFSGIAIGMGISREGAIRDLYCDLSCVNTEVKRESRSSN